MHGSHRLRGASAMVAALTLVLAACGGGSGGGNAASGDTDPNGAVSVYGTEPQNTLIPSNTAELGGAKIIEPLFAKLINFKNPGAKPYNVMAESVTTKDPKAFAEHPIGNGPMKFVSRTPNVDVKLTRFDDYKGDDKYKFKDLDVKIYSSQETAYQDLNSGKLDFLEALPPSAKTGGKYKSQLGDRLVKGDLLGISTIALPYYVPGYNNPDLRKAISLAIDRDQITKTVMNDTYVPADGYVGKGIEGYRPSVCQFCHYDPAKAKEYLQKSGFTGKLTIGSNADGGRKEPLVAPCNSIKNALGIECDFVPATDFGQWRSIVVGHKLTGMGRSDWSADYPSIEDFLNPLYKTGGGSNDSTYSNPAVDKLLEQADSTADKDAAIKIYQQAEDLIAQDLPSIPVWDELGVAGKSKNLKNVVLDFGRRADYSTIEVLKK